MQAAGEAAEVPDSPFSAQPSAVSDARALLGSHQRSVCSFSVPLPHRTHAAVNATPFTGK